MAVPKLITELFNRLQPGGPSELVLFDVNRAAWLGNLVDWLAKVPPERLWADEGGKLLALGARITQKA